MLALLFSCGPQIREPFVLADGRQEILAAQQVLLREQTRSQTS
jgi:hypothetical protein